MKLKNALIAILGICIIPNTIYGAVSKNSPTPLADDEIVIHGEKKKISCDSKDLLKGDLFAERVILVDQLSDLREKNRRRFF